MSDKDYVEQAFAAIVQQAFKAYFDGMVEAAGDSTKEAAALSRFKTGLALARKSRDSATASL